MGTILLSAWVFLLAGCYKDTTVVLDTGSEITRPVSFAADIIPIFNKSCNLSGCHSAGGKTPDLTAANAFNSLSSGNFLNTSDPENSELYLWLTGKKSTPMPVGGINKDYNALVLAWIKQGAKNN
jgi:hypothetical protein